MTVYVVVVSGFTPGLVSDTYPCYTGSDVCQASFEEECFIRYLFLLSALSVCIYSWEASPP